MNTSRINHLKLIKEIEKPFLRTNLPIIKVGDKVKIGIKIIENNKERIQFYEGIILSKKNNSINSTICIRKTIQGIGVERTFLIHSNKINSLEIIQSSKVRRSKLYYLRNLTGKASRLKQIFIKK